MWHGCLYHRGSEEGNMGECAPGCFQQQLGLELGF